VSKATTYQYWSIEFRRFNGEWADIGYHFTTIKAAQRWIARGSVESRARYRVSAAKTATTTGERLTISF
jgi:hypothetical protein